MLIPKVHCPVCGVRFTSDPGFPVGRAIQCPKCNTAFTVRGPAAAAPKPAPARPAPPPLPAPPAPVQAPPPAPKPVPAQTAPLAATGGVKSAKPPRPPADAGSRARPASPLFAFVLLGLMVAAGGGGYLLYQLKSKDRADAVRVAPPSPVIAPEPAVPAAPAPAPVRKGGPPGTGSTPPSGKPADVGPPPGPPITPPQVPPVVLRPTTPPAVPEVAPPPRPVARPVPAPPGSVPRRMLFVHASKYMYLDPLTAAPAGAAQALAGGWHVPTGSDNNQLFVLSDALPPPDGRHLVKEVLEATFRRFFETSRGQDRVVVYFGGHALERDKKAYLAPVEGDPGEAATLIPLDEFYAGLEACPAGQKVVVWDVCRSNPQRDRHRPGGPMSAALYAALTAAPPGVEVIVTCRPGENALEFLAAPSGAKGPTYSGSLFLEAARASAARRPGGAKGPAPTDPLPVAEWAHDLTLRVAELAKLGPAGGAAQTVGVAGRARDDPVRYDPAAPPAARFDLPAVTGGASPDEVRALVREFAVPPLRADAGGASPADAPYSADALKDYAPDVAVEEVLANKEKYPFRVAVIEGRDAVRDIWKAGGGLRARDSCPAPVTEAVKRQFKAEQDAWALGIARLELLGLRLDELAKDRAAQPPRWQAHYDYTRAVLKLHLAYMQEYNLAVGNVITETMPDLDVKLGHDSYALVPLETAKMKSKRAVKQLAAEAEALFEKLAAERKGTPWAVQARWDRAVPLGLAWQPATKGMRP